MSMQDTTIRLINLFIQILLYKLPMSIEGQICGCIYSFPSIWKSCENLIFKYVKIVPRQENGKMKLEIK